MATEIREMEWKYDAPPGATLPTFTDLPQVAAQSAPEKQTLRAVYHDTADLRLIRAAPYAPRGIFSFRDRRKPSICLGGIGRLIR